eukprot:PRCOL_00006187-RA
MGGGEQRYEPRLVVFSGGTAFNCVAKELGQFTTRVTHVLPVSDDGGSTAEVVRVLGGPAVGDIRSRCLRLADTSTREARAVRALLGHRLNSKDSYEAKREWMRIVEGDHELWKGISESYSDTMRGFLVHFQSQLLRRASDGFDFRNGSVGNFFFAGARTFFRSLDAAIFLYSRVSGLDPHTLVLPCINTMDQITLGARCKDGTIICGQNEISHPADPDNGAVVDKTGRLPKLASPIQRVMYLSNRSKGHIDYTAHEVFPQVHPQVLEKISNADGIVYGMGSLYTSVCPSLALVGVGEYIAERDCPKVLMLNGYPDRETATMTASQFVQAVTDTLNREGTEDALSHPPTAYVSAVIAPAEGLVELDEDAIAEQGISIIKLSSTVKEGEEGDIRLFEPPALIESLAEIVGEHARAGAATSA